MIQQKELTIGLRNYMDSDGSSLIDILNSGKGLLLGKCGLLNTTGWDEVRAMVAAEQSIIAEKNLKSFLVGYVGIKSHSVISRRAELLMFCIGPDTSRTIPDKKTLDAALNWCFDYLGLNKVSIEVIDGNNILGILESAGFISEGIRKSQYCIGGERVDSVVLSLLSSSWRLP
jgi:hypothetical protein